jgi:rRNA small subunit pseudouridine methyltransferase Nep1
MLNLVLVEAALETAPVSIRNHPSIRKDAARRGKDPGEVLLDRSLHHEAMRKLADAQRRGRPDIVHFCLLEALGSPLNREGKLRVWVHTVEGLAIDVAYDARLPRDCNRFKSLMEQLFAQGRVPPGAGKALLSVSHSNLAGLMARIKPSVTIALTSHGKPTVLEEVCRSVSERENAAFFIGAYPSGAMSDETLSLADEAVSIYSEALEAWVVTSRLIYEYERAISQMH